jgi:hypothetical protein
MNLRRLPLLLHALIAGHFLEFENVRGDRRSSRLSVTHTCQPG